MHFSWVLPHLVIGDLDSIEGKSMKPFKGQTQYKISCGKDNPIWNWLLKPKP